MFLASRGIQLEVGEADRRATDISGIELVESSVVEQFQYTSHGAIKGGKMSGFYNPTDTTAHKFYLNGRCNSELFISLGDDESTTMDPSQKVRTRLYAITYFCSKFYLEHAS